MFAFDATDGKKNCSVRPARANHCGADVPRSLVTDDVYLLTFPARNQRTIARPATVEGFGYWRGRDVRVEFRPAAPNTGIVFVRGDLAGCPRIPASIEHWVASPRRTCLERGGARVEMIEHLMAALAGLEIDNCEVRVDEAEMPGCDGSSFPFVEALQSAGIVEQSFEKRRLVVREIVHLGNEECWLEARPSNTGQTVLSYRLDYGDGGPIGRQAKTIALTPESFRTQLAPCRTFMLKQEAEWLLAQGYGHRTSYRDLLVFDQTGLVDNQLRFPDECVRHKLLDMVGDLALAGCQLIGHFIAYRSGHRMNAEMVRTLMGRAVGVEPRKQCA